jgi:hypothetical protein
MEPENRLIKQLGFQMCKEPPENLPRPDIKPHSRGESKLRSDGPAQAVSYMQTVWLVTRLTSEVQLANLNKPLFAESLLIRMV